MKIEWKDNSANVGRLELRVRQSEYTGKWGAVVWLRLNPIAVHPSLDGFGSDAEARAWCEREAESILGPLLDAARAEIAALRAEIDEERRADHAQTSHGCGDNSCLVARPTGMATNGGCRCGRGALKTALWRMREERDAARADGAAAAREECAQKADRACLLLRLAITEPGGDPEAAKAAAKAAETIAEAIRAHSDAASCAKVELSKREREVMEHAVGAREDTRSPGYRNHYAAAKGGEADIVWQGLVERGLASLGHENKGTIVTYSVTREGCAAIGLSKSGTNRACPKG